MKTKTVILVLVAAFTIGLVGCGGGGGKTPKDAVDSMMKAAKAGNWEKAVSYMDIDGICKKAKEEFDKEMEGKTDEEKKEIEEAMPEEVNALLDPKKMKEMFIEKMKEDDDMKDFEYEITDVSEEKDGIVTVTVKITPKDGEPDEQEFAVKKVKGGWKISPEGMD